MAAIYERDIDFIRSEIGVQMSISNQMLTVELDRDASLRTWIVAGMVNALGMPFYEDEYPFDWWQAFKQRWFPGWLKARFPVDMVYLRYSRYCPHKAVDSIDPHVEFLARG